MLKVGVVGAGGRMGQTVCRAVLGASDLELVAAVDPDHAGEPVEGTAIEIAPAVAALAAASAEVVVDFTVLAAARKNVPQYAERGIHAVIGTTGFTTDDLEEYGRLFGASTANAVIAPNFTIGAVLMMRFAEMAAPWFESGEIIELHHDRKIDAPSGTAVRTAQRMAAASDSWTPDPTETETVAGARGGTVDGIPVHAVRLRGVFAHQEVVLGTAGQTLTIRHDSFDRDAYMPGVLLAVREVANRPGLTIGLDPLLGV
ncbi:MAG TPA: 4-hydroxy-tetrahydrodipicolinate reductase [Acidimicrobiia bacterium]|jgi:4-hydroxy-tetrahydrodipicolinate reductase